MGALYRAHPRQVGWCVGRGGQNGCTALHRTEVPTTSSSLTGSACFPRRRLTYLSSACSSIRPPLVSRVAQQASIIWRQNRGDEGMGGGCSKTACSSRGGGPTQVRTPVPQHLYRPHVLPHLHTQLEVEVPDAQRLGPHPLVGGEGVNADVGAHLGGGRGTDWGGRGGREIPPPGTLHVNHTPLPLPHPCTAVTYCTHIHHVLRPSVLHLMELRPELGISPDLGPVPAIRLDS